MQEYSDRQSGNCPNDRGVARDIGLSRATHISAVFPKELENSRMRLDAGESITVTNVVDLVA
jgi:hypothetical protein